MSMEVKAANKLEAFSAKIEASVKTESDLQYWESLDALYQKSPYTIIDRLRSFAKYVPRQDVTRFVSRLKLFEKVLDVNGSIVECGVYSGQGLFSFAQLSQIFEPINHTRKIIGFDTFSGLKGVGDEDLNENTSANCRDGVLALDERAYDEILAAVKIFDMNRHLSHIPKIEIVKGDILKTVPKYLEENPHLVVSLLYMDVDIYKPTRIALEQFLPRMPKGAILAFDQVNMKNWPGETRALLDTLSLNKLELKRFSHDTTVCYARIDDLELFR